MQQRQTGAGILLPAPVYRVSAAGTNIPPFAQRFSSATLACSRRLVLQFALDSLRYGCRVTGKHTSGVERLFEFESSMHCPYCQSKRTRVIDTSRDTRGGVRRRRVCLGCEQRFSTYERAVLASPMVVKEDGTREEFDRDKLMHGIKIACAKRPVPAADIERLVGEVESALQSMGKPEISSRVVGDMVIAGLKEMDQIAYIRYAIVYLGLDDLDAIRSEMDQLLDI